MPLLTYITVVRNGMPGIEDTIRSILPFRSAHVEYIVIDGASTDGTTELVKSYAGQFDRWVSEPDNGLYDAMNKGIGLATGDFVCFINEGDRLLTCPEVYLSKAKQSGAAAVSFPVQLSDGTVFRPAFSDRLKIANTLHHQGTYYRRDQMQLFDLSFPVFADFDMNQRLYKQKKMVWIEPALVNAFHSVDGLSHHRKNISEIFRVVTKNFGRFHCGLSFLYFKLKYGAGNKLRSLKASSR